MFRIRFYLPLKKCNNDYRPVIWPIRYPYWCSGYTDDDAILIAYVKNMDEFFMQWPEMDGCNIDDIEQCDEIEFTSRFGRPDWYTNEHIKKMESLEKIGDLKDLYIYRPVVKNYKTPQDKFVDKFGHWWYLREYDFYPELCENKHRVFKLDGEWKTYGWAVYNDFEKAKEAANKARIAIGLEPLKI